jgi:hypothetical protein
MGVENLSAADTAKVLEMFVALIGIILLTPIFLPEQNKDIRDLVETKFISQVKVNIIRFLEAGLCLVFLVGAYIIILKQNNCNFPVIKYYLGTLAEAIFLGGMGLCAYSLFDQIAIAYMLPLVFYVFAIGGGKKLLKNFYLFSMGYGGYHEKVILAITGLLLVIVGLSYPYFSKKFGPRLLHHIS